MANPPPLVATARRHADARTEYVSFILHNAQENASKTSKMLVSLRQQGELGEQEFSAVIARLSQILRIETIRISNAILDFGELHKEYIEAVKHLAKVLEVQPAQVSAAIFGLTSQLRSAEALFLAIFANNYSVKHETLALIRAAFTEGDWAANMLATKYGQASIAWWKELGALVREAKGHWAAGVASSGDDERRQFGLVDLQAVLNNSVLVRLCKAGAGRSDTTNILYQDLLRAKVMQRSFASLISRGIYVVDNDGWISGISDNVTRQLWDDLREASNMDFESEA
ncbi:hypothetical protein PMZ80_007942 [Knufia obscura]|uniref:Uncharacterized protein n=2 Tax=Knufia TaxID=430999 RepID=A0AAN8F5V5_9EURO|nr:hypothetical protein PMZ80_007942 [Knufia obscura]KAK5957328.1 hypothetical protein OHC33_001701 [Knufia fluminis]